MQLNDVSDYILTSHGTGVHQDATAHNSHRSNAQAPRIFLPFENECSVEAGHQDRPALSMSAIEPNPELPIQKIDCA